MIEVNHLSKFYGKHHVVDDVTFSMEEGHIYGLLGPNGAGKSTTMNMMTGYLAASRGTVTIDGLDILKNARKAKQKIGYLPEIPPLYPDMTVSEYIRFVIQLKEVDRKNRSAELDRLIETANLEDVRNRLIRNLSKGYRQRVGLAGALAGDPVLVILDEPTVGLDPRQLSDFRSLLLKLKPDHIILLSSHILAEVSDVCDHIFILSKGKIILSEDAEQLSESFDNERHLHIRGLGDGESVRMLLLDLEKIDRVEVRQKTGEKESTIDVYYKGSEDIRPEISQLLMDQKFAILEMTEVSQSLEEVFLELTDKNDSDAETDDKDQEASADEDDKTDTADSTTDSPDEENQVTDSINTENPKTEDEDSTTEDTEAEKAGEKE